MRLGLIAGTVFYESRAFASAEEKTFETPHGQARVLLADKAAYIPRHGTDPEDYILPHRINHPANMAALKAAGVSRVVGVCSTGSLRASLGPGSIIVPDDYIGFGQAATAALNTCLHITPCLSQPLRQSLLQAAARAGVAAGDGGVYWQSVGPRLETKAEVNFIRHFADVVGMTLAGEAATAQELGLEYAALCSVDNFAHGLSENVVTEEEIKRAASQNAEAMLAVFDALLLKD